MVNKTEVNRGDGTILRDLKKLKSTATQQLEMINKQIEEHEIKDDLEGFRTLKDLELYRVDIVFSDLTIAKDGLSASYTDEKLINKDELKKEVIEWIKKDIKFGIRLYGYINLDYSKLVKRWMKRFNISEGDLK